ncbi:MAG: M16 family metallopeptidase, partial [Planctomycetota bacterium]
LAESIEREKAVTVDQVKQVYDRFLNAQHGQLVIVGDFDPDQIVPQLAEVLSGWESSAGYERIPRQYFDGIKPDVRSIETPDKANAFYFSGLLVPMNIDHPDYPAMVMANHILGGTFSSRLVQRIRHKDGLSYSIRSGYNAGSQDERAAFSVYAITNPINIEKVRAAVVEEIERFNADGITEDELADALKGMLQSREVSRTRDGALAGMLSSDLFLDRPMSKRAEFEEKLKALTTDQVVAAFKKHVDPAKLVVVKAGDFANAEKYAEEANK